MPCSGPNLKLLLFPTATTSTLKICRLIKVSRFGCWKKEWKKLCSGNFSWTSAWITFRVYESMVRRQQFWKEKREIDSLGQIRYFAYQFCFTYRIANLFTAWSLTRYWLTNVYKLQRMVIESELNGKFINEKLIEFVHYVVIGFSRALQSLEPEAWHNLVQDEILIYIRIIPYSRNIL